MAVYESFSYSPTELAEMKTAAMHDGMFWLVANKHITLDTYNEVTGKLVVMAVPNKPGFGQKIKEYLFGAETNENSWTFPIVEVSQHYTPPEKAGDKVTKLKTKPKLEIVE